MWTISEYGLTTILQSSMAYMQPRVIGQNRSGGKNHPKTGGHQLLQSGVKIMRLFVFKASFSFRQILTHKHQLFVDYFPPPPTDNVE